MSPTPVSTAVAVSGPIASAAAVAPQRPAGGLPSLAEGQHLTRDQIDLLKRTVAKGATDDELALFLNQCSRLRLDPFLKQVHLVKRWSAENGETMAIQVGIDGFRLQSERTGLFDGCEGPFWCGVDGVWKDVWFSDEAPVAAKFSVYRKDSARPVSAVVLWREYAQTKSQRNGGGLTKMWAEKGVLMLGKCAEAAAHRRAFPAELSGVYVAEELMYDAPEETPPLPTVDPFDVPLPGPEGSFGGNAGKPLGACPASVLVAFGKWCEGDPDKLARFGDVLLAARKVLNDPGYQQREKERVAAKAAAKAEAARRKQDADAEAEATDVPPTIADVAKGKAIVEDSLKAAVERSLAGAPVEAPAPLPPMPPREPAKAKKAPAATPAPAPAPNLDADDVDDDDSLPF